MPENQKIGNSDQKQYIVNVISNFGSKVILAWIAFWIPPVVIKNLGESQFGLISIAMSLMAYFTVVTGALNSALNRFFMLHHVKNKKRQAQEYLSSTVNLLAWFLGLFVPIILFSSPYIARLILDKPDLAADMNRLLKLIIAGFAIQVFSGVTSLGFFVQKRYDLRNILLIVSNAAKFLFLVVGFRHFGVSLEIYGYSYIIEGFIYLVGSWFIQRWLLPDYNITLKYTTREKRLEIKNFSGWVIVNTIGSVLLFNTDAIIITVLIGAEFAGLYALSLVWNKLLRNISLALILPLVPHFYEDAGLQDTKTTNNRLIRYINITSWVYGAMIGFICGSAYYIMNVWVGNSSNQLIWSLYFLVFPLCLTLPQLPITSICTAWGHIRFPAILVVIIALINVALDYVFIKVLHLGYLGAAIPMGTLLAITYTFILPYYLSKKKVLNFKRYLLASLSGLPIALFFLILSRLVAEWLVPRDILGLAAAAGIVSMVAVPCIYHFGLTRDEKKQVVEKIRKMLKLSRNNG